MKISTIAYHINTLSAKYEVGKLQELRRSLKGKNRVATYHIFDKKTLSDEEGWAFHFGGRSEIQFNIGLEDESGYFRFGLAFSLESSRSLKDPVLALSAKIKRANEYIVNNLDKLDGFQMWYYQNSKRSRDMKIQAIPDRLIQNRTFIFIGKKLKNRLDNVSDQDLQFALQTMDQLLPLYTYVESTIEPLEERVARVCWNTNRWQRPSGKTDKSKNPDAYESDSGYGHEEWLLDTARLIDGYHYGFVQCFNGRSDFTGRKMNLSLFTINGRTKVRYWIGTIKHLEVLSEEDSIGMYETYKRLGWHGEMIGELNAVRISPKRFKETPAAIFSNVRFKPHDLSLLDEPIPFSHADPAVPATYYTTLLSYNGTPILKNSGYSPFMFAPGHNPMAETAAFEYSIQKGERDLFHNRMQSTIFKQLCNQFGAQNVGTEQCCGYGARIDIAVKNGRRFDFYELKTTNSIRACIREALPQLLEYAFWNPNEAMDRLIIVSQNEITKEAGSYLKILRTKFKLPIYYQWFDAGAQLLTGELH